MALAISMAVASAQAAPVLQVNVITSYLPSTLTSFLLTADTFAVWTPAAAVPEPGPSSLLALGLGLMGLATLLRRKA